MSDCRFGVSPVNYPDPDPGRLMGPAPFCAMPISVMMLGNSMCSRAPYCPNFSRSMGIEYI